MKFNLDKSTIFIIVILSFALLMCSFSNLKEGFDTTGTTTPTTPTTPTTKPTLQGDMQKIESSLSLISNELGGLNENKTTQQTLKKEVPSLYMKGQNQQSSSPSQQQKQRLPLYPTNNNLSNGIPKSQITPGNEHLYILKSEIVPPVCPRCPDVQVCPQSEKKCPACPACARCPEPAFECKKVPNYNRKEGDYLPRPVLADFSQFGI